MRSTGAYLCARAHALRAAYTAARSRDGRDARERERTSQVDGERNEETRRRTAAGGGKRTGDPAVEGQVDGAEGGTAMKRIVHARTHARRAEGTANQERTLAYAYARARARSSLSLSLPFSFPSRSLFLSLFPSDSRARYSAIMNTSLS